MADATADLTALEAAALEELKACADESALRAWSSKYLGDKGLLKLAFGGDPKTLAAAQLAAHEEKLEELRGIAKMLEMAGAPQEQRLVAEAGIGHSREYVRFWKRVSGA